MSKADELTSLKQESEALERGDVHIVPIAKHQLMVGGKLAGDTF
jgi:hypothetical protein